MSGKIDPMTKTIAFSAPKNFSFKSTVYSHGWSQLAPFALDDTNWKLKYVFKLEKKIKPVSAIIFEKQGKIYVELETGRLSAENELIISNAAKHILRIRRKF